MTNGTLTQWRKNQPSLVIPDIHRMVRFWRSSEYINVKISITQMLEIAEGVQYIHSEGVVHGNLHGVRGLISHYVNQFISSLNRTTSFWTLTYTAELLDLDSRNSSMTPLVRPPPFLPSILLHRSCLVFATSVESPTATNAVKMPQEGIRRRQTYMRSAAFIIQ